MQLTATVVTRGSPGGAPRSRSSPGSQEEPGGSSGLLLAPPRCKDGIAEIILRVVCTGVLQIIFWLEGLAVLASPPFFAGYQATFWLEARKRPCPGPVWGQSGPVWGQSGPVWGQSGATTQPLQDELSAVVSP